MENNNQKNKRIGIILIISIVIIIIALSIVGYKMFQDDKNEETPEETTPEQREQSFTDMMKIALDAAIA